MAEAVRGSEHRKPTSAPYPVAINGIDDDRYEEPIYDERREFPALSHRPSRNRRSGVHKHHLEQEQSIDAYVVEVPFEEEAVHSDNAVPVRDVAGRNAPQTSGSA